MAHQAQFNVGPAYTELTAGLTAGAKYIVQNVGSAQVEVTDAASAGAAAGVRGNIFGPLEFFTVEGHATNKTWVRCARGRESALAINEE